MRPTIEGSMESMAESKQTMVRVACSVASVFDIIVVSLSSAFSHETTAMMDFELEP